MSPAEFKTEFLTQFDDRVAPASAPSYNNYHISLFLTRAAEQLVKNYLDPNSNQSFEGFEMSEKRRRKLNFLLTRHSFAFATGQDKEPILPGSVSYDISGLSILRIVQEHLILSENLKCRDGNHLKVVPVPHDEVDDAIYNPFRQPSKYQAWRLDAGSDGVSEEYVEIASSLAYSTYNFRYIKRPSPIIVGALPASAPTIDGSSTIATSLLPETFHSEIVSRAVTNALIRLGDPNAQGSVMVESRDE
jgi:hypothetical protein